MRRLELQFFRFHGQTLSLEDDPIGSFEKFLLQKMPSLPQDVAEFYSKCRFFIRLDFLNEKLHATDKVLKKRHVNHVNKYA